MPSQTIGDIITDSCIEANLIAPGETPDGELGQWALRKANYLISVWQAQQFYVFSYSFDLYTLVANLSPHTIGPAASVPAPTFSTGVQPRPVRVESAAQILNNSGTLVDIPINIRDAAWWADQQTKEITTNVVTDLFYDPTNPIGSLYFWPIPNASSQVRLQLWQTVSQFADITDPIGGPGGPGTLPQAYDAALMLTLAESLLPGAARDAHPVLIAAALAARAAVFSNNAKSPRIASLDTGMPQSGRSGTRGDFNWEFGGRPGGAPE